MRRLQEACWQMEFAAVISNAASEKYTPANNVEITLRCQVI